MRKEKFFGYIEVQYKNSVFKASDLEKTILDCLNRFDLCGGIEEVVRSISSGLEKINRDRLIAYLKRLNSYPLIHRLGFILEKLSKKDFKFNNKLLNKINKMVSDSNYFYPLDPRSLAKGHKNLKWKIIENIDVVKEL